MNSYGDPSETPEVRRIRLQEVIRRMREASSAFYRNACGTGNHAFIEFTGLMNEHIQICARAAEQDIDFTMANTHTGVSLPIRDHEFRYLAEKLNCIYGPSLTADEANLNAFVERIKAG